MIGVFSVLMFIGAFVWLGYTADEWDRRTQLKLLLLISLLVFAAFIVVNLYWLTDTPVWTPREP